MPGFDPERPGTRVPAELKRAPHHLDSGSIKYNDAVGTPTSAGVRLRRAGQAGH
jgi:hypothetical protein